MNTPEELPGSVDDYRRSIYQCAVDVVAACARANITVATSESLTAGLLSATIADVPGASRVLRGGVVVYATDLKISLGGVDATALSMTGPIDPHIAEELARHSARICGADIGVGLTGVAGPEPQDGHPVGEIYVAVWHVVKGKPQGESTIRRVADPSLKVVYGQTVRTMWRMAAVKEALDMILELVRPAGLQ